MDKKELFIKVIKENEGLIFKVTTLYTNSPEDRSDLSQEIIYQLWKSFGSFNEQSKLSTWMYRVALNTAIYHLKQNKRGIATTPIDIDALRFADEKDTEAEERIKMLYQHIQLLNLLEKGVILLYLEGKSHEEIAAIIGLSVTNVGTRISRIREKLKTQIVKTK
jgi:RNA polymerase sigma factor (sigma-70 family)